MCKASSRRSVVVDPLSAPAAPIWTTESSFCASHKHGGGDCSPREDQNTAVNHFLIIIFHYITGPTAATWVMDTTRCTRYSMHAGMRTLTGDGYEILRFVFLVWMCPVRYVPDLPAAMLYKIGPLTGTRRILQSTNQTVENALALPCCKQARC